MKGICLALACLVFGPVLDGPSTAISHGKAGALSMKVRDADRARLLSILSLAREGKFEEAKEQLSRTSLLPSISIHVADYGDDRAAAETAVNTAVAAWNKALEGKHSFALVDKEEEASLSIRFQKIAMTMNGGFAHPGCFGLELDSEARMNPARTRKGRLQIASEIPNLEVKHSPASLAHLVAKGIGSFLGLKETEMPGRMMGPDTHLPVLAHSPSADELKTLEQLEDFRSELARSISSHTAPNILMPTIKFSDLKKDGGECWRGEFVQYEFEFKNEGEAPLEIDVQPSCGCTVAQFDKQVLPGQTGKIVAKMNTSGFKGQVSKVITVTSNAAEPASTALIIQAKVKPTFEILPSDPVVVTLDTQGPSTREFTLRPLEDAEVDITEIVAQTKYLKPEIERVQTDSGRAFKVKLTFDESTPKGRFGLSLRIKSTSKREPNFNLPLTFEKGIYPLPPSMYIGSIKNDTKLPIVRSILVVGKAKPFKILEATCTDSNVTLAVAESKPGHEYKVTVTYAGGWPAGMINRMIVLKTDDPTQPAIEIPIMANVLTTPTQR